MKKVSLSQFKSELPQSYKTNKTEQSNEPVNLPNYNMKDDNGHNIESEIKNTFKASIYKMNIDKLTTALYNTLSLYKRKNFKHFLLETKLVGIKSDKSTKIKKSIFVSAKQRKIKRAKTLLSIQKNIIDTLSPKV